MVNPLGIADNNKFGIRICKIWSFVYQNVKYKPLSQLHNNDRDDRKGSPFYFHTDALVWHVCDISFPFVILTRSSSLLFIEPESSTMTRAAHCINVKVQKRWFMTHRKTRNAVIFASSSDISVDSITLFILQGQMSPTRRNHLHTFDGKYGDPIVPPFQVGSPGITNSDKI